MKGDVYRPLRNPPVQAGSLHKLMSAVLFLMVASLSGPSLAEQSHAAQEDTPRVQQVTVSKGFVFVNRHYLPAPYVVTSTEKGVEINGREISLPQPGRAAANARSRRPGPAGHRWGSWGAREGWRIDPEQLAEKNLNYVKGQLEADAILIAEDGQEADFISHQQYVYLALVRLLGNEPSEHNLHFASHASVAGQDQAWMGRYSPPAQFAERASKVVTRIEATLAEASTAETGLERISKFAFPMTIVGMMLSVFASGHLVSYPPRPLDTGRDAATERISQRPTVICLLLLIALSGLDLAWTLLASQAGQMIELNPLGSRMMGDPKSLVAFKTTVTLASCGILFVLRERQAARLASWWLCLALTLLTFRWLVFNSMQVA